MCEHLTNPNRPSDSGACHRINHSWVVSYLLGILMRWRPRAECADHVVSLRSADVRGVVRVLQHSCGLVGWATRTMIMSSKPPGKLPLFSLSRSAVDGGMDGWWRDYGRRGMIAPPLPCPALPCPPALHDHLSGRSGQTRQVVTGPGNIACFQ